MTAIYGLVIEWPRAGAAAGSIPCHLISLYECGPSGTLTQLLDVVSFTLHADAKDLLTAELTQERLTGDPENPVERKTSVWLVAGMRERPDG